MTPLLPRLYRSCSLLFMLIWSTAVAYSLFRHKSVNRGSFPSLRGMSGGPLVPHMVKIIDSHVHVWSDGAVPFSYSGIDAAPPADLQSAASPSTLRALMQKGNVKGAVIIQPINYKYDHSYLLNVMEDAEHQDLFRFVCLFNPTLGTETEGSSFLESRHAEGFKGVRWNPYLWPQGESMSDAKGLAWFSKAGSLNMPVGIMCFRGLSLHYEDIVRMLEHSPATQVIIDHFGFFLQGGVVDELAWQQLLSLARYPQVNVKVSAFFRLSSQPWPHTDLDPRLLALVDRFGAERLLFGSDFPFVQQQPPQTQGGEGGEAEEPYVSYVRAPSIWPGCQRELTEGQWAAIMGGTADRLYGG